MIQSPSSGCFQTDGLIFRNRASDQPEIIAADGLAPYNVKNIAACRAEDFLNER